MTLHTFYFSADVMFGCMEIPGDTLVYGDTRVDNIVDIASVVWRHQGRQHCEHCFSCMEQDVSWRLQDRTLVYRNCFAYCFRFVFTYTYFLNV